MALPSIESFLKVMQVATTPEAANYFYVEFKSSLAKAKIKSPEMEHLALEFKNTFAYSNSSSDPEWQGKSIPTPFQNLQKNLADMAFKQLSVTPKSIDFDYAISDQSQFIRGYSSQNSPIDEKTRSLMDQLFNSWLTLNNMINSDGIIYHFKNDESKDIKPALDSQGQPIKADPETFKALVSDKVKGFDKYLTQHASSIQLTSHQRKYEAPEDKTTPSAGENR